MEEDLAPALRSVRTESHDYLRQNRLPLSLRDRHSGDEHYGSGEHFEAIRRFCTEICTTRGADLLISRGKQHSFAPCLRHFTPAGPSMAPAGFFCAASCLTL